MKFKDTKWTAVMIRDCLTLFLDECPYVQGWMVDDLFKMPRQFRMYYGGNRLIQELNEGLVVTRSLLFTRPSTSVTLDGDFLLAYALQTYSWGLAELCDAQYIYEIHGKDYGTDCLKGVLRSVLSLMMIQELNLSGAGFIIDECRKKFPVGHFSKMNRPPVGGCIGDFSRIDRHDMRFSLREVLERMFQCLYTFCGENQDTRITLLRGALEGIVTFPNCGIAQGLTLKTLLTILVDEFSASAPGLAVPYWSDLLLDEIQLSW